MSGKLFTPDERAVCEKFADFNGQLINKRAAILILLDDGKTQSQACAESGMTLGQLRYALSLFRKEGIAMFPQEETAPTPKPAAKEEKKKEEVKEKKVKADKKVSPKKKKPSEKDKKKAKKKLQKASKPKKKKKKKKK